MRSLDQDDRVAVCAALHVLSGTADCKVSQTRAWSTIVREGLELLVDRGFVVEDDEECDLPLDFDDDSDASSGLLQRDNCRKFNLLHHVQRLCS